MKHLFTALIICGLLVSQSVQAAEQEEAVTAPKSEESLSLITENPEAGFQLAIKLARKGVTETQTDRKILFEQREIYAKNAELLIAASHVIAIHFQTIAAANNFWISDE